MPFSYLNGGCAKLRASLAFMPYVPHGPVYLHVFASSVPYFFSVPYVPSFFYVHYLASFFYVLSCLHRFMCLTCPYFFMCITCLPVFTHLTCLHFFTCIRCLHFFYLRASRVFTCLSASNFRCALCPFTFFIKCGTTNNQPQQARISKSEVEQTKNSLNKPKQFWVILENYF